MMQLNSNYDRDDFLKFIDGDFLTDFKRDIRPVNTNNLSSIQKANYLGESKSLGLQIFEFLFEGSPNKRVALTKDAFSIMKAHSTFRALAVFHSTGSKDWRFSLMTATPGTTEKGKVALSYSNPKRLSFFLGQNAKINTPTKFLISKGKVTDFEDLKNRFSVEVVNKEFYKEISHAFTKLVGGLLKLPSTPDKSQISLEFAVRLIGRVIFCWFLREKKSQAGTALMPKDLLSLEAVGKNEDYYHKILEPIFFEVLNKPVKSRRSDFAKKPFASIPYLNGGLFSPQYDDYYKRTNGDFQSQYHNTLIVPDGWFADFFEILETYNFTIDENTSYDEELSIDPEMLGRIFENLLAEINPETGESARKSTGSYYTPRTIVNYMVDESLLLYLKEQTGIKEEKLRAIISYDLDDDLENPVTAEEKEKIINALEKVKILDPACGSGAFPIGALQKIVFILQQTDPEGHLWFKKQIENTSPEIKRTFEREFANKNFDYIRKLGIIRENIYGVDIQPIATEISRLRCFLTLVVDQKVDDSVESRGIEPLPNLDFKFVTANSLIGLPKLDNPENQPQQAEMFDDREKINELKNIRDQYFTASGIEREQLKTEFTEAQKKLIFQLVEEHGYVSLFKAELTHKLSSWEPFSHKSAEWFDPDWMFGIREGFDIVIANPPYINAINMKKNFDPNVRAKFKETYESASGAYDIYLLFFEKGLQLLRHQGCLSFITPNKYLSASYAAGFRSYVIKNHQLKKIADVSQVKVFAEVSTYPIISFLVKGNQNNYKIETIKLRNRDVNDFATRDLDILVSDSNNLTLLPEYIWGFLLSEHFGLVKKIFEQSIPLSRVVEISATSTASEADEYSNFISGNATPNSMKLLNTGTINPYQSLWGIDTLTNKGKKYLKPYLELGNSSVSSQRRALYKKPKIIVAKIGLRLEAYIDEVGEFASINTNCFFSTKEDFSLKYIAAFIHSNLFQFIYSQFFGSLRMGGGYYQFQAPQLRAMSIIQIGNQERKRIESIVDNATQLVAVGDTTSQDKLEHYKSEINQLFYKFYRLTAEEIATVENSTNER